MDQLKNENSPITAVETKSYAEIVKKVQTENTQQQYRAKNVVVLVTTPDTDENDVLFAKKLLEDLEIPTVENIRTKRIGKKNEKGAQLLKIELVSAEVKQLILKNAKKLRQIEIYENVYLKPDLTKLQQEEECKLRKTLRESRHDNPGTEFIIRSGKDIEKENSRQN